MLVYQTVFLPFCLPVSACLSVCLSAGVFLISPKGVLCLELQPSSSEVLLKSNESFTVVSKHLCVCPLAPVLSIPMAEFRCPSVSSGVLWLESGDMVVTSGFIGG